MKELVISLLILVSSNKIETRNITISFIVLIYE